MPPRNHAILSASSSHRWLNCSPSARLEQEFEDRETEAAAEGTAAHALAEHKLRRALKMQSKKPVSQYDCEEMDTHTDAYVQFVLETLAEAKEHCADPIVQIEQRLDFSCYVPDGFGTGDCLIIADPLIKAAVGQAYILVTRPFQEGNERLSRMISYIVLMRSGYEFFRDVSISGMIARESYRYYKSMCEILRDENDGDLTYFIEYFLDMLSRALETKKQADLQREQNVIEEERNMSRQPLRASDPSPASTEEPAQAQTDEQTEKHESDHAETSDSTHDITASPPGCPEFWAAIDSLEQSISVKEQNIARVIRLFLKDEKTEFTLNDWQNTYSKSKSTTIVARNVMIAKGLIENISDRHEGVFRFALDGIKHPQKKEHTVKPADKVTAPSSELIDLLSSLEEHAKSLRDMRIGKYIRQLIDAKVAVTSANRWSAANAVSKKVAAEDFRRAVNLGILKKVFDKAPNYFHYEINMTPQKNNNFDDLSAVAKTYLTMLYNRFHQQPFTVDEGSKCIQKSESTSSYHFLNMMSMGILERMKEPGRLVIYYVAITPDEHPECFIEDEIRKAEVKAPLPAVNSFVGRAVFV